MYLPGHFFFYLFDFKEALKEATAEHFGGGLQEKKRAKFIEKWEKFGDMSNCIEKKYQINKEKKKKKKLCKMHNKAEKEAF